MKKRLAIPSIVFLLALYSNFLSAQEPGVYIFVSEECPISIYMAPMLKQCLNKYPDKNYYLVYPMKTSNWKTAVEFRDRYDLTAFKVVIDADQKYTHLLEARITPEVVIVNTNNSIAYRGRISDAYRAPGKMKHGSRNNDLLDIIEELNSGNTIPAPWKPAIGCYITLLPQAKS